LSFWSELKQRRVIRVLIVYAIAAWAVIQVADTILPRLGAPDWTVTFIIIVAGLGLPIALLLAWFYDITPEGIQRAPRSTASRNVGLIGLGMVIALVVFGAYWRLQPGAPADDQDSVAVLPFADLSESKDQEYFADGITEEILNVLAQFPDLRVPGRTSSFSFKNKNLPIREIAGQLNVAHVLEGSVRKAGDRVRITAQLIDARTDRHLWSDVFDRNVNDVFAVQGEIARAIGSALEIRFKSRRDGSVAEETHNPEAHESYLKGLYYWHRRHTDELPLSLEFFQQAARLDPRYARAHAGVALAYAIVPQYTLGAGNRRIEQAIPIATAIREGKAAAARALALDPKAADAHAALGQIAQEFEWDWRAAAEHYDQALKLDPNYGTAHQWRAELHVTLGEFDDAITEINRALSIDPLSSVMQSIRSFALFKTGRRDEAINALTSVVQSDPGFASAQMNLLGFLLMDGRYEQARAMVRDSVFGVLSEGAENPSKRAGALHVLAVPKVRARMNLSQIAIMYLLLEQNDSAAALFNRAADAHEIQIYLWPRDPLTRPLDSYPQFKEFRRKLNL